MENNIELFRQHLSAKDEFKMNNSSEYKREKLTILASKIRQMLEEKNINKSSFAEIMDVHPSIVTRWLSGTHNFTVETLFDIEFKLKSLLIFFETYNMETTLNFHVTTSYLKNSKVPVALKFLKMIDYNHHNYKSNLIHYEFKHIENLELNKYTAWKEKKKKIK